VTATHASIRFPFRYARCRQLLQTVMANSTPEEAAAWRNEFGEPPMQDPEALSFWLACVLRLPAVDRYNALKTTSLLERLDLLSNHQPRPRGRWLLSSLLGRWAAEDDPSTPTS